MHFDILTLFPEMFAGIFDTSILGRAQEMGRMSVALHNIREHAPGKHRVTDDTPYGGGGGMIMKPEPIYNTVEAVLSVTVPDDGYPPLLEQGFPPIILLTPQGEPLKQALAHQLIASYDRLVLLCGRYEGVDERVRQYLVTHEISIGDYVLSGGEIAAMVVVDALTRLLPNVLGDDRATHKDSYADGLLEHPHYTRPAEYRGRSVPDILLSGHHANVQQWQRQQSLARTLARRPDLLETADLSEDDLIYLRRLGYPPEV